MVDKKYICFHKNTFYLLFLLKNCKIKRLIGSCKIKKMKEKYSYKDLNKIKKKISKEMRI